MMTHKELKMKALADPETMAEHVSVEEMVKALSSESLQQSLLSRMQKLSYLNLCPLQELHPE